MTDIDKRTVRGLCLGDDQAYVAVIRALREPLYRFALRLCRDRDTAEDITQQTFLAVWQSVESFRWKSKFSTWVFGIAYRQYLTVRRRDEQTVDTVPLEEWYESDHSADPSAALEESELRDRVRRAVYALPDPYREVVCLVRLEGLTCREAAGVLDVPIGTIKSRVNRAIEILRDRLGESGFKTDDEQQPEVTTA